MGNILIVTGHGRYATAIKSTLEILAGRNDDIKYIDFTEEDTDITLKEKMKLEIDVNKGYGILFVCDLLGGTPFKSAVELSISNENIEVVAGCNVGAILEISLQLDSMPVDELADFIVDTSNKSTIRFRENALNIVSDDLDNDMGI
mgnify:CR=1 FL=1